jgi:hypothetical protein
MTPDQTTTLDLSPLSEQPAPSDVAAWRKAKSSDPDWSKAGTGGAYAMAVIIPIALGMFAAFTLRGQGNGAEAPIVVIGIALATGLGIVGAYFWSRARWAKWMRIDRFARANAMTFSPGGVNSYSMPLFVGMIFDVGGSRTQREHVTSRGGRWFDYGSYVYTTGSGKSRQTHDWGYLAFKLDRKLPQMVLDARANDGILSSNLPTRFNRDQHLSLEGDFDKYFTLYCPSEYERDALYVFTPDLMALLIDEVSAFDVEVVDDWMFVYSTVPFALDQPAVHQRMFQIMQTVGTKTVRQTQRYADDRVPDSRVTNIVAPQGRRLRRSIPIGAFIAMAAVLIVIFANIASTVGGR